MKNRILISHVPIGLVVCIFLHSFSTFASTSSSNTSASGYVNKYTVSAFIAGVVTTACAFGALLWYKKQKNDKKSSSRAGSRRSSNCGTAYASTADSDRLKKIEEGIGRIEASLEQRQHSHHELSSSAQQQSDSVWGRLKRLQEAEASNSVASLYRPKTVTMSAEEENGIIETFLKQPNSATAQPIKDYVTLTHLPGYTGTEYSVQSFTDACKNGDVDTLQKMVDAKCSLYVNSSEKGAPNATDTAGNTIEALIVQHATADGVFSFLRNLYHDSHETGACWFVSTKNKKGQTPLWLAYAVGNHKTAIMFKRRLNANMRYPDTNLLADYNGDTPAHIAAKNNHSDIFRVGLEDIDMFERRNAGYSFRKSFNAQNLKGELPADIAIKQGNRDICKLIFPHMGRSYLAAAILKHAGAQHQA